MNDMSLHILDLAHNAMKAKASTVHISVEESPTSNRCQIIIEDDGYGMDDKTIVSSRNPFFTSRLERRVGLGVPLFIQSCEQANGHVIIQSKPNIGTKIIGNYDLTHIDAIPLGDMEETIYLLMIYSSDINIVYTHRCNNNVFKISTVELMKIFIDIPLTEYQVMKSIKQYIKNNIIKIRGDKE